MADPFSMLESDHRLVEGLLSQLAESEEGAKREELVRQLSAALGLHMDFEEANVYPLSTQVLDEESTEEATNEHGLAREGVGKLAEMVSQPGFGAAVAMVQAGIGHHVEEEEGEMFPALRKQVGEDQQDELARQLVVAKRDAGVLTMGLDQASKEQLVEIAGQLGVEAKSSMTKAQLRQAVESSAV